MNISIMIKEHVTKQNPYKNMATTTSTAAIMDSKNHPNKPYSQEVRSAKLLGQEYVLFQPQHAD